MSISRAQIEHLKDVLRRERQWRDRVFRGRQHDHKVGEIDQALGVVHAIEAALKGAGLLEEPYVQATLLPSNPGEPDPHGDLEEVLA